jgi:hypothetical protein
VNKKLKQQNRHIALLIDNAGGHNVTEETKKELTHITLKYFEPNCTSWVQPDDQGIIRAFKAYYRRGVVRHCSASLKQHGKIIMPNMKEAIILIREAWKMVSNQTIYNCWKKAGIIDCEEKEEEIDCLIEKEVTKYTYALDEQLKMINREEFFKQFLHPSLRTDEFIDIDKNEQCNVKLTKEDIVDIIQNKESVEEAISQEEKIVELKDVNVKEALDSFENVKAFIERSEFYNANACHLITQIENLIHDIESSKMRQTEIIDYFKKL